MSESSLLNQLEAITRGRRSSSASSRTQSNASIPRPVSLYHEPHMWDHTEEDLIQLNTPRLSPITPSVTDQGEAFDLASDSRRSLGQGQNDS